MQIYLVAKVVNVKIAKIMDKIIILETIRLKEIFLLLIHLFIIVL